MELKIAIIVINLQNGVLAYSHCFDLGMSQGAAIIRVSNGFMVSCQTS